MRFLAEAEMEATNYTFLKALFMSGSGCSDRRYLPKNISSKATF
jgi:hypothetical protein